MQHVERGHIVRTQTEAGLQPTQGNLGAHRQVHTVLHVVELQGAGVHRHATELLAAQHGTHGHADEGVQPVLEDRQRCPRIKVAAGIRHSGAVPLAQQGQRALRVRVHGVYQAGVDAAQQWAEVMEVDVDLGGMPVNALDVVRRDRLWLLRALLHQLGEDVGPVALRPARRMQIAVGVGLDRLVVPVHQIA